MPKDRALGTPVRKIRSPRMTVAFFLVHLRLSTAKETTTSNRAMALVTAANSTSAKKRIAKTAPPLMEANPFGRVPNISPGHCPGSRPKENTAGQRAIPAITAMMVSSPATLAQLLGIFSLSPR